MDHDGSAQPGVLAEPVPGKQPHHIVWYQQQLNTKYKQLLHAWLRLVLCLDKKSMWYRVVCDLLTYIQCAAVPAGMQCWKQCNAIVVETSHHTQTKINRRL